jgi:hypothetical protein
MLRSQLSYRARVSLNSSSELGSDEFMRRYRTPRYERSIGLERAKAHIEAARQLSIELGGTDQDVKSYFFGLPAAEVRAVLEEYGHKYGLQAKEYAQETIPKWRTGRVHMSGLVAGRLYALLPTRMPLEAKYKLTEDLWRHVGPSSKKTLRVGSNVSIDAMIDVAYRHIDDVVTYYKIPVDLERRFNWLSSGDIEVKQTLLNHLRVLEKTLVVNALRARLPVLMDHLNSSEGRFTQRLAQVAKVGKHELEILLDRNHTGVRLEETTGQAIAQAPQLSKQRFVPLLIAALIGILFLIWLGHR